MLVLLASPAFSQDSLRVSVDLSNTSSRLDSITSLAAVSRVRDSLKINAWSDSLKQKVTRRFSPQFVSRAGDSLRKMKVPEPKIDLHTDSLMRKKDALLNEVNGKQDALQKKVSSRYESWVRNARSTPNLDSAGVSLPSMKQPDLVQKLPGVPGMPAAGIPGLPAIPELVPDDFGSAALSPELAKIGGDIAIPSANQLKLIDAAIPEIPNPLGDVAAAQTEIKQLTSDPGAAAEKAVGQLEGVSTATDQLAQAQQLAEEQKTMTDQLKDPQAAVPQMAFDHFAGKEEVLQKAMESVAKYKQKYESLASIADVKQTWWPVNGLKGKPFKERFRLGMSLGVRSINDTLMMDFFPSASYRISGRFEAGLGFLYRLRLFTRDFTFDQQHPVWGVNTFVVVKTYKAIFFRVEADANSYPSYAGDVIGRHWRWSFLSGVQTNFKISNRVSGNVQMLYNFDASLKDGFPERLSVRVGVQYRLKTKPVPKPVEK